MGRVFVMKTLEAVLPEDPIFGPSKNNRVRRLARAFGINNYLVTRIIWSKKTLDTAANVLML